MKGKRKQRSDTTPQLLNNQLLGHNRNLEWVSTSMRQDEKRKNLYNCPLPFNVNESYLGGPSWKQTTPGRVTDNSIQEADTIEHVAASDPTQQGVSSTYVDVGDCDQVCEHCKATFWYNERLKKTKDRKIQYHRCCGGGKVVLPIEPDPPNYIKDLFKTSHFLDNIRAYNQMFSMTSFGADVDESVNDGRGPYVFKISGQIYHWIGKLCPTEGDPQRFLQLYIYDTQNEVTNRMRPFGGQQSDSLCSEIVEGLIHFLNEHNELVKLFRTARDKCEEEDVPDFKIRLYSVAGLRQYELPTSETLGAIVFERGPKSQTDYDVIIELKDGMPQRINKLHPSFMSLQFPLIFIYGQPGFIQ